MTISHHQNRHFAESLIARTDPEYRQRWEVYDAILERLTGEHTRWLDGGCGINEAIAEFPSSLCIGIDRYRHPQSHSRAPHHLVLGNLTHLPFPDGAFNLITLNTVVEHFSHPAETLGELRRVLAPDGHLLIHTTNRRSPLVFLGRLLPEPIRMILMKRGFGAQEQDVFPAYHRLNTISGLSRLEGFECLELHAVQDLNWSNRAVFLCLLGFHLLTRLPGLWKLRTNIIALYRRSD